MEPIDLERASRADGDRQSLPPTVSSHLRSYSLLWIAGIAMLLLVLGSVPAGGDEPGSLRWLRTCADHPLRVLTAVLLLAYAARPDRGPL